MLALNRVGTVGAGSAAVCAASRVVADSSSDCRVGENSETSATGELYAGFGGFLITPDAQYFENNHAAAQDFLVGHVSAPFFHGTNSNFQVCR